MSDDQTKRINIESHSQVESLYLAELASNRKLLQSHAGKWAKYLEHSRQVCGRCGYAVMAIRGDGKLCAGCYRHERFLEREACTTTGCPHIAVVQTTQGMKCDWHAVETGEFYFPVGSEELWAKKRANQEAAIANG